MAHSAKGESDMGKVASITSSDNDDNQQLGRSTQRGKPPTVCKADMEEILEQRINEIVVENSMVQSNNAVYYELAQALRMTKQAVYLAAKRYIQRNRKIPGSEPHTDEDEYLPLD